MRQYKHLNLADRQKIAALYGKGVGAAEIGEELGIARSSVYRELQRGFTGSMDHNGRAEYSAELAQRKQFERRRAQLVAGE